MLRPRSDVGGRRGLARWLALAACLIVGLSLASPAEAARRVALVIGNGEYASFGHLANPTHDADDVATVLTRLGFSVVRKDDVDERGFIDLLSDFATEAQGADIALFYYSGHGLQYNNENYLLPVDAVLQKALSLTHETVPLSEVLEAASGARTTLVFIDACRSFPSDGTFLVHGTDRGPVPVGLARVSEDSLAPQSFIGFSAGPGKTAGDGAGRNSPFTAAMLRYLPQPGLSIQDMFSAVHDAVVQDTHGGQDPQSVGSISSAVELVAAAEPATTAANGPSPAEQQAYAAANDIGTIEAFQAFLGTFPNGFYATMAQLKIDKLQAEATSSSQAQAAEPTPSPSTAAASSEAASTNGGAAVGESAKLANVAPAQQVPPALPTTVPTPRLAVYGGLDFYGNDISQGHLPDLVQCATACQQDRQCKAFTFNADPTIRVGPNCFLKSDDGLAEAYSTAISGTFFDGTESDAPAYSFKTIDPTKDLLQNTDLTYNDLSPQPDVAAQTLETCRQACLGNTMCAAFSYVTSLKQCWLKGAISPGRAAKGVVSGIKRQVSFEPSQVLSLDH